MQIIFVKNGMSAGPTQKHDPVTIIRNWCQWNNEKRAEDVAGLYAEDAVLQPTFSNHVLMNDELRLQYFTSLGERKGLEVFLHEKTLKIRNLGAFICVASGIYRFSFEIDEEPLTFEARFTWVMDLSKDRPIQHHHSSQVPRTLG